MEQKLKQYKTELKSRGYSNLSESENEDDDNNNDEEEEIEQTKTSTTLVSSNTNIQQEENLPTSSLTLNNINRHDQDDFYVTNNRINEIIHSKHHMSNSTSSNSVLDHTNTSLSSTNTSGSSEDNLHETAAYNSKVLMNYPPQTGLNIVNASSSTSVDPFFQNHPFFSQNIKQDSQQQSPLQNYFK